MRRHLSAFFRIMVFWTAFMVIARLLFLGYNYPLSTALTASEIFLAMLHGSRMDASMTAYFLALCALLLTASILNPGKWIYRTVLVLTFILLLFCSTVVTADLELYRHWGFRMNNTPFFYMGKGAVGSVEVWVVVKLVALLLILFLFFWWFFMRWVAPHLRTLPAVRKAYAIVMLAIAGLMFIPIRGSFSVAPMNTGFVYFHTTKAFANHAAINVIWNFLYSVQKGSSQSYPEKFFDRTETIKHFSALYPDEDSTTHLLHNPKPDIILIILESFTADVIEPLGGVPGITPRINEFCREGILFDNFYATGDRTDKGIIGILSGYPAQPTTSIIKNPSKTQKLPHLNQNLKQMGYHSSFIYGGDVDFANFRSYLTIGGFDHITTMDAFPPELNESKWGVHDHFMFARALNELDSTRSPFFKVILTLSSHEPFDVPMTPHIQGNDHESLFLNSCFYTDKSLGVFIDSLRSRPQWDNTWIIITADHGHRHPRNKALKDKERFRIPMLWMGGAIKKDTVIHTLSGQTDIAETILAQLGNPVRDFPFGKNILAGNCVPFAAYFFNDGYGFLMPDKYIVHDNPGKQFLVSDGAAANDLDMSKAYQQMLFSDYNAK